MGCREGSQPVHLESGWIDEVPKKQSNGLRTRGCCCVTSLAGKCAWSNCVWKGSV